MKRKARAIWNGNGKEGKGYLTTDSTVLDKSQYSFNTRFENGKGTNPEELVAAAHSGCFAMQLTFNLQNAGFTAEELDATCTITLENGSITQSHINLIAKVPGVDSDKFAELVKNAEKNCPISKLLNTEIKVDYKLN